MIIISASLLMEIHFPQLLSSILILVALVAFISIMVYNHMIIRRTKAHRQNIAFTNSLMNQALKISQNNVVRYEVRSQYIYTIAGTLFPPEGITLEKWKEHLHPEDAEETLQHFRDILSRKAEQKEFHYRWNFNFDGGEPQWGYMHNISVGEYPEGQNQPDNIISTLVDETELLNQQHEEEQLADRYRLIFEESIVGLSFYDSEGNLLAANREMRRICHFDSEDGDTFFGNVNMFEMPPFNECVNLKDPKEFWVCYQSIIPEREMHDYLEIHYHPIFDDTGRLIYHAVSVRNITEERELYRQAVFNDLQIRKANEEIQHYEDELRYLMDYCEMKPFRVSFERDCVEFFSGLSTVEYTCTIQEIVSIFFNLEDKNVQQLGNPREFLSKPITWKGEVNSIFSNTPRQLWVQVNCIPEYDDKGQQKGCFGVYRNITKLMHKQEMLRKETERANDSGHQKSVFLANMTHEIRTPLNAIVGFSDLLQTVDSPDDKKEMIRIIHNNCDMLLRLIDDILALSNVDANSMQLVPERVDFSHVFDDICQSLRQRVQEPGVEFLIDNPLPSFVVEIDHRRIQQVITNFVTNAVKYTHQGHIRVGYRQEERESQLGLYVYCEDTGSGIPKEQCERVFERFVKLNDFIQGTGLGLSICKAIIEKCGGMIGVDSEEGKGSTFWFWIPTTIQ